MNKQANEAILPYPRTNYHAYLLRFWRLDNAGQPRSAGIMRVGVGEPGTQMPSDFEHLAALFVFLAEQ